MSEKWIKQYHDNHYIFNGFRDKCAEHAAVIHSDDAFAIYQELHAIFGKDWIACSEQMPEEEQEVIVGWNDCDGNFIMRHDGCGWEFRDLSDVYAGYKPYEGVDDPTHWHPIPTL